MSGDQYFHATRLTKIKTILPETKYGIREAIRLGSAIDAANPHH